MRITLAVAVITAFLLIHANGAETAGNTGGNNATGPTPSTLTTSNLSSSAAAKTGTESNEASNDLLTEITHPANWFTWGFESRNRHEFHQNANTLQESDTSTYSYLRLRNRIWANIEPFENLSFYGRFMTEPRFYYDPVSRRGWANDEGLFDSLYLQVTNVFSLPMRLRLGRQEIQFGDRWMFFDGTHADGSRSEFFDAARLTFKLNENKTTMDVLGLIINSETDEFLPVMNDRNEPLSEQDERAGAIYVTHKFRPELQVDAHYIYRHISRVLSYADDGNLHVPGVRVSGTIDKKWDYVAETAVELGEKNQRDVFAYGFSGELGLNLGGAWKHRVMAGYELLSGDDPDTAQDEGWDPMYARRARWSELMVFTFGAEARGRRGYFSNLQKPSVGWSAVPVKNVDLSFKYMPMFSLTNPNAADPMFSEDGKFRGHLMQTVARFRFTKNLSGLLWHEILLPGDFYATSHRDTANFTRAELSLTF